MKNYKLLYPLLARFLFVFSLLFLGCNDSSKLKTDKNWEKEIGKTEYPAEWMYNQRAYPDNFINKAAIEEAIAQSKLILSNRPEGTSTWEFVGPLNTGGRVTDVAISPVNDEHLYVATATGGIFRSYDKGSNWTPILDRKSTRLNSSHVRISYAVFCLKKKKKKNNKIKNETNKVKKKMLPREVSVNNDFTRSMSYHT